MTDEARKNLVCVGGIVLVIALCVGLYKLAEFLGGTI